MKWLLTLQSWEGCMWEKHTGILCLCPPPNQKGQKKEQSHCAGMLERGEQLQRADGLMRTSSILSRSTGKRGPVLQGTGDPLLLCPPFLQGAALPGCPGLDLSPAKSSDVAVQTLLWDRTEARQRHVWSCLSNLQSG